MSHPDPPCACLVHRSFVQIERPGDVAYKTLRDVVEYHPLHLHGYRFWVVASGPLPYNESAVEYNLIDPLHVDTFPVRTGYYYVLRLRANNPGMWHLHCHLVYHM